MVRWFWWVLNGRSLKKQSEIYHKRILNCDFFLSNIKLNVVQSLDYLGFVLNTNLDFNPFAIDKFKKVQKSFFSASFLLNKMSLITSSLKSFIFKTFCLSQFTYGLENITLDSKTLNINQNNLIRQMFNLKSNCNMSGILKFSVFLK